MTSFSTAQEPVPEGMDLSGAPLDTPAPESSVPPAGTDTGSQDTAGVEQPEPAPQITGTETETGTDEPAQEHAPGMVTIYAVPPMGTLTIPADGDGEPVVIDRSGTEVDEETAQRAREAAAASGFRIREE
jgi:hypothetical protein